MKKIIATGKWGMDLWGNYKWEINYSSILSELIRCAGKCSNYASDLFIDWSSIENDLKNPNWRGGIYMFGFRDSGVDATNAVNHNKEIPNYYNEIRMLEVIIDDEEITMELTERAVVVDEHKLPSKYRSCTLEDAAIQAVSDAIGEICHDFGIECPEDYDEDNEYTELVCGISNFIEAHA